MAARKEKTRTRASLFTKVLLVVLLAAMGLQLRSLHAQVQEAEAEKDQLAQQVQLQQLKNRPGRSHMAQVGRVEGPAVNTDLHDCPSLFLA